MGDVSLVQMDPVLELTPGTVPRVHVVLASRSKSAHGDYRYDIHCDLKHITVDSQLSTYYITAHYAEHYIAHYIAHDTAHDTAHYTAHYSAHDSAHTLNG